MGTGFTEAERRKLACAAMNYNLDVIKAKEDENRTNRPASSGRPSSACTKGLMMRTVLFNRPTQPMAMNTETCTWRTTWLVSASAAAAHVELVSDVNISKRASEHKHA